MKRIQPPGSPPTVGLRDDRTPCRAMSFLLLLLCVLVRFPFYFASSIEWDESTFILMGQDLLNGNLPYVHLWDNKPPLLFAFFALTMMFGKSIVAVRLAGTICVFLTAWVTWRIGSRIWARDAGLVAAVFSVVFISLIPSYGDDIAPIHGGQATLSEIIALVPTMGALLVLLAGGYNLGSLFLAGCLLSIASLVRTNLGYLALAVGIVVVCSARAGGFGSLLKRVGAYALGGLLPLALVFLPYVITGNVRLFADSVFVAPLTYVQSIPVTDLSSTLMTGFDRSNALLWAGFLGGLALAAARWTRLGAHERRQTILVAEFFLSVAWSIASSGSAYEHYRIQVIPFMALFAGSLYSVVRRYVPTIPLLILLFVGLAAPARPLWDAYAALARTLAAHEPVRSDAGYRIAAYIAANNPSRRPVYMLTDHIVYWLLGMQPITKSVTHPSTIGKKYLLKVFLGPQASTEGEMAALLDKMPLFVVKNKNTSYLSGKAAGLLDDSLDADYALVEIIEGRYIYQRMRQ